MVGEMSTPELKTEISFHVVVGMLTKHGKEPRSAVTCCLGTGLLSATGSNAIVPVYAVIFFYKP